MRKKTLASGLAKSLKAARLEAKNAKGSTIDLSPLAEYGSTPTEIAEKFGLTVAELNDKLAKGVKLDPEKIKAELAKGYDAKIAEKDGKLKGMETSLTKYLVTSEATRAIAESKGVPELLMPHISASVKVVADGSGGFRAMVVDADGDARVSSVSGQAMTIQDLVKEMKASPVFGRAFESEAAQGGGARPGAKVLPQRQNAVLSSTDKIRAGLAAQRRG